MTEPQNASGLRVAQYVRMSTDHQLQSIACQMEAIGVYAAARRLEIVRTYADEGRSGLTLKGRPALRTLLADIVARTADYDLLLVYDVSRWGRFQDIDESAHYEFLCRQAGIEVVYVAEPFGREVSAFAWISKGVKRAMAAEYSRELGERVLLSHRRLAADGHRQGGAAPFGYQRWEIDDGGRARRRLPPGELRSRRDHSIALRPGPLRAVRIIREIFDLATVQGLSASAIARTLNHRGVVSPARVRWRKDTVLSIISNPVYAGHCIYGLKTRRLGSRSKRSPRSDWVVHAPGCPALVDQTKFDEAQRRLRRGPPRPFADDQLLEGLRRLLRQEGRLSSELIVADPDLPSPGRYRRRFGSLLNAYERIGHDPATKGCGYRAWQLARLEAATAAALQAHFVGQGWCVRRAHSRFDLDGLILDLLLLTRCWRLRGGWKHTGASGGADLCLVGRVTPTRDHVLDYAIVRPERLAPIPTEFTRAQTEALAEGGFASLSDVLRTLPQEIAAVTRRRVSPTNAGSARPA